MKHCYSFNDLRQFGIYSLTGEADALGFRILCDLDEQGVRVFKELFGIPLHGTSQGNASSGLATNWNCGDKDNPHIASVMLTGHDIPPLAIMGFYLQGHTVVVCRGHDRPEVTMVYGLEDEEIFLAKPETNPHYALRHGDGFEMEWPFMYGEVFKIIRKKKSDGQVVQGTRNVHQMSGRVS